MYCTVHTMSALCVTIPNIDKKCLSEFKWRKPCIKHYPACLDTLSSFPLLLNSHASSFLPFKPIIPTFILYFCLFDRWLPPTDPQQSFSSNHVAIQLGTTTHRVCRIDGMALAHEISKLLKLKQNPVAVNWGSI